MPLKVSIVGGSGYVGGEVLRLLLQHPKTEVIQVTSESYKGNYVYQIHPNLRGLTSLKFTSIEDLERTDICFVALPHKISSQMMKNILKKSEYVIDKGTDFRLNTAEEYREWYKTEHACPELLDSFVYGMPEINREAIKKSKLVACPGCNATATILGLYPFFNKKLVDEKRTVVDIKTGSSEGGNKPSLGSHHPERNDSVRSYKPSGHRHMSEIKMILKKEFSFSATTMPLVRGILMTAHLFLEKPLENKEIWNILRETYANEPFIRIVKSRKGIYRYPEPKIVWGTNYCDIGFEIDQVNQRLIIISSIDNLMKGASGQAIQCMNIMLGFNETLGLTFPGLHPI